MQLTEDPLKWRYALIFISILEDATVRNVAVDMVIPGDSPDANGCEQFDPTPFSEATGNRTAFSYKHELDVHKKSCLELRSVLQKNGLQASCPIMQVLKMPIFCNDNAQEFTLDKLRCQDEYTPVEFLYPENRSSVCATCCIPAPSPDKVSGQRKRTRARNERKAASAIPTSGVANMSLQGDIGDAHDIKEDIGVDEDFVVDDTKTLLRLPLCLICPVVRVLWWPPCLLASACVLLLVEAICQCVRSFVLFCQGLPFVCAIIFCRGLSLAPFVECVK